MDWYEVKVRLVLGERQEAHDLIAALGEVLSATAERPWMMATQYLGRGPGSLRSWLGEDADPALRRERPMPTRPGAALNR